MEDEWPTLYGVSSMHLYRAGALTVALALLGFVGRDALAQYRAQRAAEAAARAAEEYARLRAAALAAAVEAYRRRLHHRAVRRRGGGPKR